MTTTPSKFKIETGVQLLARLTKKIEIVNFFPILFERGLKYGDTVEIFSDDNNSYLLVELICAVLLPFKSKEEPSGVILINTAGKFNYEEFVDILRKKVYDHLLKNQGNVVQKNDIDEGLYKALNSFYYLEAYDSTQFYTTINNMDNILLRYSNVSLVIFDTMTAFFWAEQGFKITKMDLYVKNLLTMIQKVSKEYKIILVYTKPAYFSSNKALDNIETVELTDGIQFKVQLIHIFKGLFEVNVRTKETFYKKRFNVIKSSINWE